jgi:hypothetical protein
MEIIVREVISIIITTTTMIEIIDRIAMIILVEDFEVEVVSIVEVHFFKKSLSSYDSHSFIGRGGGGGGNSSGPSRFYPRGNNRVSSHEHSSSHRSSRSPDRSFSYRRDHDSDRYPSSSSGFSTQPSDEYSHRQLPTEALRKKDKSNFDAPSNDSNNNLNRSSANTDESIASRSGHNN